jgi:bifunctional DNA-binding transcriptional regulator/antitoxin component of YhaV-PrlF toxin-antitoxin module
MKRYTIDLIQEGDDTILPLTDEILMEAGWNTGDDIEFINNNDGSYTMRKVEKQEEEKYYLVECTSTYRMRYMVKAKCVEHAEDTVVCAEAKEFSQKWLGEAIIGSREISNDDIIKLCDEDNDYVKTWSNESKFKAFVTENIYDKDKKTG